MPPAPTSAVAPGSEPFRLPRTIEPEIYHIEIEPDVASATFSGTVRIDAIVHEAVDEIVLNAAELAISDVEVLTADGDRPVQRAASTTSSSRSRSSPPTSFPRGPAPSAAGSAAR